MVLTTRLSAFRAAVSASRAMIASIARQNEAIGAGVDVDTIDGLIQDAVTAKEEADRALAAACTAFGLKPVTWGGRKHNDARLRVRIAVHRAVEGYKAA